MPTPYRLSVLKQNLNAELPDNSEGLITAEDVRENVIECIESLFDIVGDSGRDYALTVTQSGASQSGSSSSGSARFIGNVIVDGDITSNNINILQGQVTDLDNAYGTVAGDIATINDTLTAHDGEIVSLNDSVLTVQSDITTLQACKLNNDGYDSNAVIMSDVSGVLYGSQAINDNGTEININKDVINISGSSQLNAISSGSITITGGTTIDIETADNISLVSGSGALNISAHTGTFITNGDATSVPLRVRVAALQSGNMLEVQDNGATNQLVIDSNYTLKPATTNTLTIGTTSNQFATVHSQVLNLSSGAILLNSNSSSNNALICSAGANSKILVLKGFTSQTGNYLELQNNAGTNVASISGDSSIITYNSLGATYLTTNSIERITLYSSTIGVFNNGAQDYDFRFRSLNDTVCLSIDAQLNAVGMGVNLNSQLAKLHVVNTNTVGRPVIISQNMSGQTSNNFEARNSGGTAMSGIRADGSMFFPTLTDAAAVDNSLYYSSTQSKLVYKVGGVANPLY